jgi:hypothetical protein
MLIGGKSIGLCSANNCSVAVDSGTTYMMVPEYAKNIMINHGIPVAQKSFPCTNSS